MGRRAQLQIIVYGLMLIGAVVFTVGAVLAYRTYSFSRHAKQATGIVQENILRISHDDHGKAEIYYYPRVRFHSPDGHEIVFEGDTGSDPPAHPMGTTVQVLYDPNNPKHAQIRDWTMWMGASICAFIGILFAGFGGGLFASQWRRKRLIARLRLQGRSIEAQFTRVEQNRSVEVNDAHPYRIVCQWSDPESKKIHVFKSENIWFDPEPYTGKILTVRVDPANWTRYFVDTDFLAQADENRHRSLRERWARRKEDYRQRLKALRERSLDRWLFGIFFLSVFGLFSLTAVSRSEDLIFAIILSFGLTQFSLWHRRSLAWEWPGPHDNALRSTLLIVGVTALLSLCSLWIVPSSKSVPWYSLIFGTAGYLVLKELGVIADSETPAKRPRSKQAEGTIKRAARLGYQVAFVLVWLAAMVSFCFKDYLWSSVGSHAYIRLFIGVAAPIAWVGAPTIAIATPLLHYTFGANIFPRISRSISAQQSPLAEENKTSAA